MRRVHRIRTTVRVGPLCAAVGDGTDRRLVPRSAEDGSAVREPDCAGPQAVSCRWCGQPIRWALGAWVHDGARGGFYCRDTETGMFLSTPAAPPRAVGRHKVGSAPGTDTQRAAGLHLVVRPDAADR